MGQALTVVRAISCSDCAKYVCNACTFHSECCDLCNIDFVTTEVDLSESELEIESDCCFARKT